jgi:hypothetical protein
MYAPAIQEAIAKGDLPKMKELANEGDKHLRETGDVRTALEYLRIEIARLEHRAKSAK